ncbi:MAG: glycosyltransferase family 9 protein [Magnetococcales bacterium]|nr:glycosyltransferase family 9 protein [Magnetococcales bacterium]
MSLPPRILVIKSRHLGDVLLTGPLISSLRLRHPEAFIAALVKPDTRVMLEGHPHLNAVLTFVVRRKGEGVLSYVGRLFQWWRHLRGQRFDWVISTTKGDRGLITALLSGASRRVGLGRRRNEKNWRKWIRTETLYPGDGLRHTVIRNLNLLGSRRDPSLHRESELDSDSSAGTELSSAPVTETETGDSIASGSGQATETEPTYRSVHMAFDEGDARMVAGTLEAGGWDGVKPLIQVHPTSRWFFKCWDDIGMAQAIDFLASRGCHVVVTGAPSSKEREKNSAILSHCQASVQDLTGALSIKELAALTARCQLFFGVDTAPMHMAAALDIPVVGLLGPSKVWAWGPWPNGYEGARTPYPKPRGNQRAGKHTVIQKDWECVPCGSDGCEGSKKSQCLDELTPDEVISELKEALARTLGNPP